MRRRFRAEPYSVYEIRGPCVRANLPRVEASVVSSKVSKLDPIFWVFKITSASKYGSGLAVRWKNATPKK